METRVLVGVSCEGCWCFQCRVKKLSNDFYFHLTFFNCLVDFIEEENLITVLWLKYLLKMIR